VKKLALIFLIGLQVCVGDTNLLDTKYKNSDKTYNMIVEIPAGTNEKWEVSKKTGKIEINLKHGKKRVINFLPYPGNYGFIPQTKLSRVIGGDDDPIDVLLLSNSFERGSVVKVKIIGGLDFLDRGERDTKLIAVLDKGVLSHINTIEELFYKHPNILSIVKLWFEGYKGFKKMQFTGYISKKRAKKLIEESHSFWKKND